LVVDFDFDFGIGIEEDGPAVLVSDPVVVLELGVVPVLLEDDSFGGIVLAILIRVSKYAVVRDLCAAIPCSTLMIVMSE
jgi:hypothetical protein